MSGRYFRWDGCETVFSPRVSICKKPAVTRQRKQELFFPARGRSKKYSSAGDRIRFRPRVRGALLSVTGGRGGGWEAGSEHTSRKPL
jgi:hypothetical protein